MRTSRFPPVTVALLGAGLAFGQPTTPTTPTTRAAKTPPPALGPAGSRFDLDFRGGTPKELVESIQNAMGGQVNVIIADEYANTQLPALKMKDVSVPQLFEALEAASRRQDLVMNGPYGGGYSQVTTSYGFRKASSDNPESPVWYFYVEKPNYPGQSSNKICRFYPLAGYLQQGATVDDITTAIETGAHMLGEPGPAISFHKETKLLIAVGDARKLEIIDAALSALRGQTLGPPPPTEGPIKTPQKTTPDKK